MVDKPTTTQDPLADKLAQQDAARHRSPTDIHGLPGREFDERRASEKITADALRRKTEKEKAEKSKT